MIDILKLKGKIAESGLTQQKVAQEIGISNVAFYRKMQRKRFNSEEMDKLITILHIDNPSEIFFAQLGTHNATN